jgi:hypothetical protein
MFCGYVQLHRGRGRCAGDTNGDGGFNGGEVNSPSSNLSSIHEWSGSVMKTIGKHQIQAGGGWDEVNYTAELRQGSVTFSGASTANFNNNTQNPNPTAASPGSHWRAVLNGPFGGEQLHGYVADGLSTIRTQRISATFFCRSGQAVSAACMCRIAGR